MLEVKPLGDGDFKFNQQLSVKRGGDDRGYSADGRVVRGTIREEVIPWGQVTKFTEDDAMAGVTQDDLDQMVSQNFHLSALFGGAPAPAQGGMEEIDPEVSAERASGAIRFADQAHYAAIKRVGLLVDQNTGESLRFRRLVSSNQVELTDENTHQIIEVLSNQEFETLIRESNFEVL